MAKQNPPPAVTTAWGSFHTATPGLPSLASEASSSDAALTRRKTVNKTASLAARPSVRFALDGDDLHAAVAAAVARANASHQTEPGAVAHSQAVSGSAAGGPTHKPALTASASARGLAAARPAAAPYRASEGGACRYGAAGTAGANSGAAVGASGAGDADSGEDDGGLDTCHCDSEVGPSGRSRIRSKTGGGAIGVVSDDGGGDSDLVQTWSGEPYCVGGQTSRRSTRSSSRSRSRSRGRNGSGGGTAAGNAAQAGSGCAVLRLPPAALASGCSVTSVVSRTAQMSGAFTPGSLAASAAASLRRPSSVKLRAAAGWASEGGSEDDEEAEDEDDDGEEANERVHDVRAASPTGRMPFAHGAAAAVPARVAPPATLLVGRGSASSASSRGGTGRGGASPKLPSSSSEARGGWRGYWRRGWSHFVAALGRGKKKASGSARAGDAQQQQHSSAHERQGVPASGLSTMSVSSRSPSMLAFRLRAADSRTVNLRRMSKAKRNRARPSIFATGPGAAGPPPPSLPPAVSRFAAGAAAGAAAPRVPQPPALRLSQPQHAADPRAPRMSAPGLASGLGAALPSGKVSSSGEATAAWVAAGARQSSPHCLQAPAGSGDRQSFQRHSSLPAHRGFLRSSSSVVPEPAAGAPAPKHAGVDVKYPHEHQQATLELTTAAAGPTLPHARTVPRPKKTLSFSPTVHNDCGWTEPLRGTTSEGKRPAATATAPVAAASSHAGPNAHAQLTMKSATLLHGGATPVAEADGRKRVGWLQKLVRVFSSRHDPAHLPATSTVTATPFLASRASAGGAPSPASGDSGGTWGSGSSDGDAGAGGSSGGGAASEHAVGSTSICSSSSSSNARAAARMLRVLDSRVVHHRRLQHQHEQQQQHHQQQQSQPQPHRLQAAAPTQHQQRQLHQQACDDDADKREEAEVEAEEEEEEGVEEHDGEGADAEARAALRRRLLEHAASVREAPGDAGGSGPFYFLAATASQ
ncbi:hypothetical protein HXX76_005358 [Chlamydomonas incerta]|uniref:Uncharacterized protein n=1 Tax=Chlamydomonas incerta TaxID=51695 RepID=A0A835T4K1_CHLIN|nr:hypothetical protein HXX76_005358 [Chlamydomonas incerta]|eukprot:KAG2438817.1 hypothetical protein HXX76_005358 [Chlamydomonas incerta]